MTEVRLTCLCGRDLQARVVGNNNADGKADCRCGRKITVHFRRTGRKTSKTDRESIMEWRAALIDPE